MNCCEIRLRTHSLDPRNRRFSAFVFTYLHTLFGRPRAISHLFFHFHTLGEKTAYTLRHSLSLRRTIIRRAHTSDGILLCLQFVKPGKRPTRLVRRYENCSITSGPHSIPGPPITPSGSNR